MKNFLPQFSFIALAFVLVNNVSAQNVAAPRLVKDPVSVEIANQPDSPLLISLVSVDTTDERYQKINITIQNVNEKPIRGYVLAGEMITTMFFPAKPFLRGLVHNEQILFASENIRSNDFKVTLLVD